MLRCCIEGIALWSPSLPGWALAAPALRATEAETDTGADLSAGPVQSQAPAMAARPAPALLAANERRRAPDTVLVALEVASQALLHAGFSAADSSEDSAEDGTSPHCTSPHGLASVFVSSHGDLPITDALCATLASSPRLLSPTRFHHSVHNAASGYWAIGSGSRGPSTALSAHEHSFAIGWLEAASLCVAEQRPVLLVAYDTSACGGLASVNRSRGLLGVALLVAPAAGPRTRWQVQAALCAATAPAQTLRSAAARGLADNAMAQALPLFEALAAGNSCTLAMAASAGTRLELALTPMPAITGAGAPSP